MEAKFQVEQGELKGLTLSLNQGEQWLIGRDPEQCEIILEDSEIERVQLKCTLQEGRYYLENVAPKKAVLVNSTLLSEKIELSTGDQISIGALEMTFLLEEDQDGIILVTDEVTDEGVQGESVLDMTFGASSEDEEEPEDEDLIEESADDPSLFDGGESAAFSDVPDETPPEPEEVPDQPEEVPDEPEEVPDAPEEPEEEEPEEDLPPDIEGSADEPEDEDKEELEEEEVEEPLEDESGDEDIEDALEDEPEEDEPEEGEFEEVEEAEEEEVAAEPPIPMFEAGGDEFEIDLTLSSRFTLKVIAGPNTGAEFAIESNKEYLIGTDTTTCDIIFHDLSVSREHAKLQASEDGTIIVEDLSSRNGVIVDQKRITEPTVITSSSIVTVGTTSFFLIDKEAPQETIVTPLLEPTSSDEEEEEEEIHEEEAHEEREEEEEKQPVTAGYISGAFIFSFILIAFVALLGYGVFTLSQSKELVPEKEQRDFAAEVQDALNEFSGVRYTYNRSTRQLFLVGHVTNAVAYSELVYNLQGLKFLRGVQNNVVNDEAVWQEMNLLLAKKPEFKGVSMHSPSPGVFVLGGYLKTEKQASDLVDYVNLNFNYLSLLENRVVVEEEVQEEVLTRLIQNGFGAVKNVFAAGDLSLTGYIGANQVQQFEQFTERMGKIPGVRNVQNYVIVVKPEQQVIDLNVRYPGRYIVTGYSKHGDVNVNVVINGKILMRGDTIDEMTITSIQPHTIFLERDGLKYKIEYNK